ncbi:MAG: U32 family peptidase [Aristaeellaceae bacterium]
MLETLAPAGNREALDRAVAAGANAVYLGYAAYSARAGAGNFDAEQLREAVAFAHLHHVRVHVTVNTLVKDGELDGVMEVLRLLAEIPVDGVLVQDLGVLRLARRCFPDLPVHASTQMAIHNAAGVRWCRRMGMTRAVLARECSLKEIALCAREGIEIEVFGHGAQCVAVSGQCLFSSMIGGRSGNRGRCAQPCRLPYAYRGKTAAWLSPRDVCLRDHLPALAEAGAVSLKIEGRLKRPEYVAAVAGSYRRAIDSMAQGAFRPADGDERRDLLQIFQRGGFMDGYALGAEDAGVICEERVNHGGVPLGEVEAVMGGMARVRVRLPLHDGDGLQLRGKAGDQEMIYSGKPVAAGEIAVLRLRPDMRVHPGDGVVRLTDAEQLERARALTIPPIPADMRLTALPGSPLRLTVTDGETSVMVEGETVAPARSRAMTAADALRSLDKTGDTPFMLRDCRVETEGAFVPVSALNALRRDALIRLADARSRAFALPRAQEQPADAIALPEGAAPEMVIFRTAEQLAAVQDLDARLVWYPEDWREDALEKALSTLPRGVWLQLPMVCEEATLEMLHGFVGRHRDLFGGVALGSVGQLGLAWPVPYGAGAGIPVMNRRAAQLLLEQGCEFVTASPELTGSELAALMAGGIPAVVPAYGRTQLMLLHHCPARTYLGLSHGHAACQLCDRRDPNALAGTSLTDRRGVAFPLLRQRLPEGCLVRLMNSLPTDNVARVRAHGWAGLHELTDETGETLRQAALALHGRKAALETTAGHWSRPVE